MFKRFTPFLLVGIAIAQPATLTLSGPATVKAGQSLALTLVAAGPTGSSNTGIAAVQWTLGLPAGIAVTTSTTAVPNKTKICTVDMTSCILYGMNTTLISNGIITSYVLQVPVSAVPGTLAFSLSTLVAVDGGGLNAAINGGTPYTVAVLDPRDINGDTKVDIADVSLMANEAVASRTNPAACVDDVNKDGKCDVIDVFLLVLKSLGLIP